MSAFCTDASHRSLRTSILLAGLVVLAGPVIAGAQEWSPPTITRIEEDWVLAVNEPNGSLFSPQFHTVISPTSNLDSYYFQVTWNYRELPGFAPGGFQVQSWYGEDDLESHDVVSQELSRSAEFITWTQVLETNGNQIAFSLINGRSQTWGYFDHPQTTIIQDGTITSLAGYSPEVSVNNSCITYGQNRVYVLRLTTVRYYSDMGLLWTDYTDRDVYRYNAQ
jgi:hypothetical protein